MKIEEGLPDNPLDEPAEVRVARGVALLDSVRPAWRREVTRPLRMDFDYDCVLGQVFGYYPDGVRSLGLGGRSAERYGFIVYGRVPSQFSVIDREATAALTPLWEAALAATP